MRFVLLFLFVICAATASAADVANPVEALKKSLHKGVDAAHTADKTVKPKQNVTWMDLPLASREKILHHWNNLPETTRPPFPVYRDAQIEKYTTKDRMKTQADDVAPLVPSSGTE